MNKDKPLVSVVMATFNEPTEFIKSSINSILCQTYSNLELIIVDDSTNKDTIKIIDNSAQSDKRITIIREKERMGFVKALNIGLKSSKGVYIARMDGDDISMPDRLEKEVKYLETHKDVDIIGGAMNIINEYGKITSERFYPLGGLKLHFWSILRNPLAHPTVMFRSLIVKQGFLYDEDQKKAEDIELWLRLKRNGFKIKNMSDKLLNYRVVGNLALKRNKEQWIYNYKARKKNLSLKYPLFSILTIIVSFLFTITPNTIVKRVYKRENSKKNS